MENQPWFFNISLCSICDDFMRVGQLFSELGQAGLPCQDYLRFGNGHLQLSIHGLCEEMLEAMLDRKQGENFRRQIAALI
jgi:hypothetical protein